jgi:copper homeostasis protein CutC
MYLRSCATHIQVAKPFGRDGVVMGVLQENARVDGRAYELVSLLGDVSHDERVR